MIIPVMRWSAILALMLAPPVPASGMGVEDSLLRPSEIKLLQRVAAVDFSFLHGDRGTILVTPKDVVKTGFHCGISTCATRIERNGRVISGRSG